jgi:hypothetical protein
MKSFIFGLFLLALVSGCASNKPHDNVPLAWKPTSSEAASAVLDLTGLRQARIAVRPFTDNRQNRNEIGKNIEHAPNKLVTTKDNVADWCTAQFKSLLVKYGLNVTDTDPNVVINGEVADFHVNEDNTYNGATALKISVADSSDHVRWQGTASGTSKRFGRSYKLDNYYETLSDAYIDTVANLLRNKDFVQALAVTSTATPVKHAHRTSPATKKRSHRRTR